MNNATISADVIASTSLTNNELERMNEKIRHLFELLEKECGLLDQRFFGRLIKGDYIECFIENPQAALRIALLIKTLIKSFSLDQIRVDAKQQKKRKLFQNYGIRLSLAVGKMSLVNIEEGLLNGDAIYKSGRRIEEQHTSNKKKVVVKNTLFFDSENEFTATLFESIIGLLDTILNKSTTRQSEILHQKLLGKTEQEIADEFQISQSSVNQQSSSVGWNNIERALNFYEKYNFE